MQFGIIVATMNYTKTLRAAALAALSLAAVSATAATYWLDNSVAASGDGTTKETAFKSWNEALAYLGSLSWGSAAELNVVASETPYFVTNATPTSLKGYRHMARIRGVNADGTDVADPASVVLDGQGLYQIAPCGTAIGLTISGLTFANASSAAGTMSNAGSGSAIDLKEYDNSTDTGGNVVSNCVFTGCSGGAALLVVGSSNTVTHCVFKGNASTFVSGLDIRQGKRRTDLPSYVRNCRFEGNNGSAATSEYAQGNAVFASSIMEISDCTFRANVGAVNGAAAYLYGGFAMTISDCVFASNTNIYSSTSKFGGVVADDYGDGNGPVFRNCTFSDNVCENACGAFTRGSSGRHPVAFFDCTFDGNKAKYGAAITLAVGNKTLLASNCTFRANSASSDGVVYRGGNSNVATYRVDLVDCVFAANGGNSVLVHAAGTTTTSFTNALVRCVFAGNATSSHIVNYPDGIFTADGCAFTNNALTDGTTIRCGTSNPGAGTTNRIANCLFARNTTGGATVPSALSITYGIADNCTFVCNTNTATSNRGAIWASANTLLRNCIFKGNNNNEKWNSYVGVHNCFVDFSNANLDASNIGKSASADPGFADAANGDYTLLKNSVCRDAGDNSVWAGVADAKDLAGNARIAGSAVDLGCYEWFDTVYPTVLCFK